MLVQTQAEDPQTESQRAAAISLPKPPRPPKKQKAVPIHGEKELKELRKPCFA